MTPEDLRRSDNPFRVHMPEVIETLKRLMQSKDPLIAFKAGERYNNLLKLASTRVKGQ